MHDNVKIPKQYINQALKSREQMIIARNKIKEQKKQELENLYSDEHYYFIAGYTSGGFPYGITWEEHEAELKALASK